MENYCIKTKLGSGNFAKVYLATHIPSQQEVALKLINKQNLSNRKNSILRVAREVSNMELLGNHENIVSILETFETEEYLVIAMEYLPGGELFDYVLEKDGLSELAAKSVFKCLAKAVQHCHNNGITHRDLKLENILLDSNNTPKIADFGLSKPAPANPIYATYCGSPLYTAPEIMHGRKYRGPECDVWSMGVILYVMLTASMPFNDGNLSKFMVDIDRGNYTEPTNVSTDAARLISKMLNPSPEARYSIHQVLAHPWLAVGKTATKTRACTIPVTCDCSCHGETNTPLEHCSDCETIVANDSSVALRQIPKELCHSSSEASSGYGSEFGSQMLTADSPVHVASAVPTHLLGETRRASVPRKGKLSTPHGRNSIPSHPLVPTPQYSSTSTCSSVGKSNLVFI